MDAMLAHSMIFAQLRRWQRSAAPAGSSREVRPDGGWTTRPDGKRERHITSMDDLRTFLGGGFGK